MKTVIKTEYERIYFCSTNQDAEIVFSKLKASKYFVLTDENTSVHCLEHFRKYSGLDLIEIKISSGEKNKTVKTVEQIWEQLFIHLADRKSLLINLGGGMITDIGGFSAATFKRGIRFVNIPTTMMGMVDAAIGGKCGVNFQNSKNQIGSFYFPEATIICTDFLKTLSHEQQLSGFAECVKHAILKGDKNFFKKTFKQHDILKMIYDSAKCKAKIVEADAYEKGDRQFLNFGHSLGHALESYYIQKGEEKLHGFCVAAGMLLELAMSSRFANLNEEKAYRIESYIRKEFGSYLPPMINIEELISLMKNDKKNENGSLVFVLMEDLGKPVSIDIIMSQKYFADTLNKISR